MRGRRAGPRQAVACWLRALDPGHQQAAAAARWRISQPGRAPQQPARSADAGSRSARAQPVEGQRFRQAARSVGGVGRSRGPTAASPAPGGEGRTPLIGRAGLSAACPASYRQVTETVYPLAPALRGLRAVAIDQVPKRREAARPLRAAITQRRMGASWPIACWLSAKRFCVASAKPGFATRAPGAAATQGAAVCRRLIAQQRARPARARGGGARREDCPGLFLRAAGALPAATPTGAGRAVLWHEKSPARGLILQKAGKLVERPADKAFKRRFFSDWRCVHGSGTEQG